MATLRWVGDHKSRMVSEKATPTETRDKATTTKAVKFTVPIVVDTVGFLFSLFMIYIE